MNTRILNYNHLDEQVTETCIVLGMPNSVYHSTPAINKSSLDLINRSVAHFWYSEPMVTTRAMEIGTAIHTAILEPSRFETEYMILPDVEDRRSSQYKQAVKEFGSEFVLIGKESDKVVMMRDNAYLNEEAAAILNAQGWCEARVFYKNESGVLFKCRFDKLTSCGIGLDVKKTQDVRYDKLQRAAAAYRFHVQDAFYSWVYEMATGQKLSAFKFFAVEEMSPCSNKLFELDDEAKQVGAREMARDIENYLSYDEMTGLPPGLVQQTEVLSLPLWALDDQARNELDSMEMI